MYYVEFIGKMEKSHFCKLPRKIKKGEKVALWVCKYGPLLEENETLWQREFLPMAWRADKMFFCGNWGSTNLVPGFSDLFKYFDYEKELKKWK